jgi:AraC-like DNA-binding protein
MTPALRRAAAVHICDLIALALGASRDGAAIARERSIRVARLQAIKADIEENLSREDLTVNAVARRQCITPRYVQKLFETEGSTFSEYVLGQRLCRAQRMILDARLGSIGITEIAYAAGFGDLSYFNRTFRRQFGASPSELRRAACQGAPVAPAGGNAMSKSRPA